MASNLLINHLPKEERDAFHKRLIANDDLFERSRELIGIKIEDARTKQLSDDSYDSPAWSERQADLNGYQRALEEIKQLLTLTR